ncbi:hypothetical protein EYZ11_011588 [Aspergillus tanneri]|uniref:Uncharacterized protein n=1 Tax=Aspergillus tanneri TaxID=1220188 RepID=A0A4S3J2F4_9EURO|nr:hypothetical protein EYZ11_011588 [Aspergillus tanneri]
MADKSEKAVWWWYVPSQPEDCLPSRRKRVASVVHLRSGWLLPVYTAENLLKSATTWTAAANAYWGNGDCVPGS